MRSTARLIAAVALGLPAFAQAGPADYVNTPNVEYGEREIDFKYGTEKLANGEGRESAGSIGFGYGATTWWFTEAYVKAHKLPGDKTRYDAFEWENKFQLTEPNKYPVDLGFFIEVERPQERAEGYEWAFGPLFQFDTGPIRWNVNPVLEKVTGSKEEGPHPLELGYQLQVAYRLSNGVDVGLQAFGDLGKWNEWAPHNEQEHRIGPAIFGKVKLGEGRQVIRYNAAFLWGQTNATPQHTFRVQAEYEF